MAVERTTTETSHARLRGDAGAGLGDERWNGSFRRIDDEPRPAAFGDLVDIAELRGITDAAFGIALAA